MPIKHIFFDLDHTLWDFETNSKNAYAACFKKYAIPVNLELFIAHYSPINEAYWKRYREEKVTKDALKYGRLKDTFDQLNYTISDELVYKLADEYLVFLPQFNQLFEGTIEILDYLSQKYTLHIITNGFEEIQTHKMRASGLDKYFVELITSEHVGVKKPNPKVFYYALEKAKALAQESIMVGDNFEADVLGALNVGMQAIHFNPQGAKDVNKNEIKSLFELIEYL